MAEHKWRIWTDSMAGWQEHLVRIVEETKRDSVFQGHSRVSHLDGYSHYVPPSELREATQGECEAYADACEATVTLLRSAIVAFAILFGLVGCGSPRQSAEELGQDYPSVYTADTYYPDPLPDGYYGL